jgi:hypothetical protein
MLRRRATPRGAILLALGIGSATVSTACSDLPTSGDPDARFARFSEASAQDIAAAIAAQERYTPALMRIPGVHGTAVGLLPGGRAVVRVFVTRANLPGVPSVLDNVPVARQVTGMFVALTDPTVKLRPVPLGFSVGHPAITAGTIGARVLDGAGRAYILSNNHVLANSNDASTGDATFQPGPYDGGTAADQIGTLAAFKPIVFTSTASNTIDAAIALVTKPGDLLPGTPTDDGYGAPNSAVFGDANNDGMFDDRSALLDRPVMKYGRTTRLTRGTITGVNATLTVCYEPINIFFCGKSARFVDQIVIGAPGFSGGGDSGSLIVTDDSNRHPVGLLFAGNSQQTIANRIDLVLSHFNVTVDDGSTVPPTPVTDVAITAVTAPVSVVRGGSADITVTVRNVGNQPVTTPFSVSLSETPDNTPFAPQSISGLDVGAQTTRTFIWTTTSSTALGSHSFSAALDITDDNSANNTGGTTVNVTGTVGATGMHVADLGQTSTSEGRTWTAIVLIRIHDANHANLGGAIVTGSWSDGASGLAQCTFPTGDDGICFVSKDRIKNRTASVRFTVTNVSLDGQTYVAADNHDEDGDSNGTTIVVLKP